MNEMVQEVAAELEDVAMQLLERGILDNTTSVEACQGHAEAVIDEFQRLQLAGEMLGYPLLQPLTQWLIENTQHAANIPKLFIQLQNGGHFFQWAELLAAAIRQQDTLLLPDLTSTLTDPAWPISLSHDTLEHVLVTLAEPATQRCETAPSNSAYKITWDDDVHPEILSAFLSDTPDQISESTSLIHKIAQGHASNEEHRLATRLTHTIKGASGVVGVTAMTVFTHQLEEILEHSLEHKLTQDTQELLLASADCLGSMGDAMLQRQPLPPHFNELLAALEAKAHIISEQAESLEPIEDEEEVTFAPPPQATVAAPAEPTLDPLALSTELLAAQTLFANTPTKTSKTNRALTNEASMRVPISLIDDLLNLAEELVTSTSQVNDRVKHILQQSQQLRQLDERMNLNMDELEHSIDQQFRQVRQNTQQDAEFDQLELETYNELHSIHSLLGETLADSKDIERNMQQQLRELSDQLHSQQRINRELNTTILDTRMESLETLTPRLERIVRETCRSTGKKATLTITGSDLAVDTDILKGLTDPLLHLLRNAVDHGIEMGPERVAQDKPELGSIRLSFSQKGRYVTMILEDDGKGMDAEAIYQRALKQAIVDPSQVLNDNQKLQLILLAGFTTRDSVSDISGRGVGMDVVQDAVSKLRGTLNIDSTPNKGSRIDIRLPLTLVAANTLMADVAGHLTAIPVDSIDRLHTLAANTIRFDQGQMTTLINDQVYQVRQLSQLLNWGNPKPDSNTAHNVVLIDHKQQSYALIVNSIMQPREVVVKSLAPWLNNVPGINGACLLSDGAVSAVLDLPRLLQFDNPSESLHFEAVADKQISALVLIVDDSLSNRKALSITAEQLGYRTVTAIDGEEALQLMAKEVPNIILSDLEMPRMNGLELAQSVRKRDTLKHLPFIMITSRATNKHRKQAKLAGVNDYLVKPVERETLQNYLKKWLN